MKKFVFILLSIFILGACERDKEPPPGDLKITTKYDGLVEKEVKCWLYDSYEHYIGYTYLYELITDDFGQVLFEQLEPGWYFLEAEKIFPGTFTLEAFDSVEVVSGKQVNKILILEPRAPSLYE